MVTSNNTSRWNETEGLLQLETQAILTIGGTISHQHGVGFDHAPFMEMEKGEAGLRLLQATLESLDPDGILNPGKLIGDEEQRLA